MSTGNESNKPPVLESGPVLNQRNGERGFYINVRFCKCCLASTTARGFIERHGTSEEWDASVDAGVVDGRHTPDIGDCLKRGYRTRFAMLVK